MAASASIRAGAQPSASRRPGWYGLRALAALIGLVMLTPTLIVIPMSLTGVASFQFPPPSWSTHWYSEFFQNTAWYGSLGNSLIVAVVTTVVATSLGTAAALALVRGTARGRGVVQALLLSPMIVPTVVAGIGIYRVYLTWHLTGSLLGFVAAHTSLAIPLVTITVSATLRTVDPRIEDAAASLGAGPLATFRSVTLPLILPGVLVGAVFAFMTSFDEVVVSIFLATAQTSTLPVQMYTNVTREIDPTVAAASTMLFLVTTTLLFFVLILRLRERRLHGS
jgi:putative spermidine/putrescine transport system permease protein